MKTRSFLMLGLGASLLSLSCNGQSDGPVPEMRDGVVYVHNPRDGLWQDAPEPPIRFELEQTFGVEEAPEEAVLSSISYLAANAMGDVFVLDGQEGRLICFRSDGIVRWAVGRKGQGPGEFQRPQGMAWDGGTRLLISNQSGSRLDVFDTEGNYVRSHTLAPLELTDAHLVGMVKPNTLVFSKSVMGKFATKVAVVEMSDSLSRRNVFEIDHTGDLQLSQNLSVSPPVTVLDGHIFASHVQRYQLEGFNLKGQLQRVATRDLRTLVRPGVYSSGDAVSVWHFGGLNRPVALAGGFRLLSASWPTNVGDPDDFVRRALTTGFSPATRPKIERAHTLDLYDRDWRLVYSISGQGRNPEIGQPNLVDADGKLYTVKYDPYPHVRRYRVVIREGEAS